MVMVDFFSLLIDMSPRGVVVMMDERPKDDCEMTCQDEFPN
jgi:hypothetical protein